MQNRKIDVYKRQELIQDIENGEIIALSAALPGEFREAGSAEVISEGEDAIAATALSPSQYYLDLSLIHI